MEQKNLTFLTNCDCSPIQEETLSQRRNAMRLKYTRNGRDHRSQKSPLLKDDSPIRCYDETNKLQKALASVEKLKSFRVRQAVQDELAYREQLGKFASTVQLRNKEQESKKKADTAKIMNKHAFKLFRAFKDRQQKTFDLFKIETLYDPDLPKPKTCLPATRTNGLQPKELSELKSLSPQQISLSPQQRLAKSPSKSVSKSPSKSPQPLRYKFTRYAKREQTPSQPHNLSSIELAQPKVDLDSKMADILEKKQALTRDYESKTLLNYIRKQNKILEKQDRLASKSKPVKTAKHRQDSSASAEANDKLQAKILAKLQAKDQNKLQYLSQKAARVREELQAKQNRRDRFREQKELELLQSASESELGSSQHAHNRLQGHDKENHVKFRHQARLMLESTDCRNAKLRCLPTVELQRLLA